MRRVLQIVVRAGLTVSLAVTTSEVAINGGDTDWTPVYVSLAIAVVAVGIESGGQEHRTPGRRAPRPYRELYLRQLSATVREMKTVGIATRNPFVLRMRQVYVDVSLVPGPPHHVVHEPHVGEVPAWQEELAGERRTLRSFLDQSRGRVLAVIGGPGTGKTTLVQSTALSLSARRPLVPRPARWLPVLLYLRDHAADVLAAQPPDLPAVATRANWLDGRVPAEWLERQLRRRRCLVLLDGLDEVTDPRDRGRVVDWVQRQLERYPGNNFVLTSRPHGYSSAPLASAEVLLVRRFTGEQIRTFLHRWSYETETRARNSAGPEARHAAERDAEDLLARLHRQPALFDLAANPLLLTMIATVHRYRGALPRSRAELYAEMTDVLLHRRIEERGLADPTGLTGAQKERVARHLAMSMMRERRQDVSTEEAAREIRRPMRQVSRALAPEVFLDEVRKSGLLVEREQGVYAFAHLTLQEYLAAASIADRGEVALLRRNVDDPWWRETTLLWAANADATPVLDACLASGTVDALVLAFDCKEEAAEIEPGIRALLDALLAEPPPRGTGQDARARLVLAAKAARGLRETIHLRDRAAMCARPVSRELWGLFQAADRAADRQVPAAVAGQEPVVGMWADDVTRFLRWLNGLFGDGPAYRLPTAAELADPAARRITDLTTHTAWAAPDPAEPGTGPRLLRPASAGWPYPLSPGQLRERLAADHALTAPYLRLALAAMVQRTRLLDISRVFAAALQHAPALTPGAREESPRHLDPVLRLALARLLHRLPARPPGAERAADTSRAHALALALGLPPGDPGPSLDDVLQDGAASGTGIGPAYEYRHEPDPAAALDSALHRALRQALDRQTPHLDPALEGMLVAALTRPYAPLRDADLQRFLVHIEDLGSDYAPHLELDVALDLALGHRDATGRPDLLASTKLLHTAVTAFAFLVRAWSGSLPTHRPTPARPRAAFEAFLRRSLRAAETAEAPENALVPLEAAREHLGVHFSGSFHSDEPEARARGLTMRALGLVRPILTRTAPCDGTALACARMAALAAAATLRAERDGHPAIAHLHDAYLALAALDEYAPGGVPTSNDVLLLIREPPRPAGAAAADQ